MTSRARASSSKRKTLAYMNQEVEKDDQFLKEMSRRIYDRILTKNPAPMRKIDFAHIMWLDFTHVFKIQGWVEFRSREKPDILRQFFILCKHGYVIGQKHDHLDGSGKKVKVTSKSLASLLKVPLEGFFKVFMHHAGNFPHFRAGVEEREMVDAAIFEGEGCGRKR